MNQDPLEDVDLVSDRKCLTGKYGEGTNERREMEEEEEGAEGFMPIVPYSSLFIFSSTNRYSLESGASILYGASLGLKVYSLVIAKRKGHKGTF